MSTIIFEISQFFVDFAKTINYNNGGIEVMIMEPSFTFAQRLEELKRIKGYNNSDIAKICGIDKSNLTRYCKGEYKAKQDVLFRMAEKLNVSEAWLMGYDVPMDRIGSSNKKRTWLGLEFFGDNKEPVTLSHDELDMELMKRLMQLTPEELEKVDSFVQGILASR